ncbi:hypothetical protein KFK09_016502 [Dendrobium nobile]|uniref:Vacuolar protein sorting-associated protein 13 VPS13 adaptor binding domain-containing protein n=1 Tax=Dendrobium nobile TaxID=94219 RepID=A0A8T3AZI9_DENNO|nr:hypothetical protein KFK09_016502 [Dendrobium nobile]
MFSMFVSNFVRSNFVSRLRPWLVEEPELEIELGLLASQGCAKKLKFEPSALNPLIEGSTFLEFKRVEVGELSVRVRPWTSPSIVVEVRGLHVTLAHRVTSKLQDTHRDSAASKKKETIAFLDSEGASLHDAIERLLARDTPGDRLKTSWANIIASCSQIKFQDFRLELQLLEKSHACLLELDEFSIDSQCLHSTSLFRKSLDSLLVHGKMNELSISCSNMKFGVKENERIKWITSLLGLSAHFKLIGFHPLSNYIHVPSLVVKLSPEVIPLLLLIVDAFSSKKHGVFRTGKELWRIAANRIGHLTLGARSSVQNIAKMVVLWSRYVHAYSCLLTLVGSLAEVYLKETAGKHSIDRKLIIQAKHQLGLIFHLEEKLPAQMVVQARRIARYKRFHVSTDLKKPMCFFSTLLRNILAPFWLLWKVFCFIFQAVLYFALNFNFVFNRPKTLGSIHSSCFSFEEVFISLSHSTYVHFPVTKNVKREEKQNLPSFYLTLRQLCLFSKTDETIISFLAALGEIKLCLADSLQILLDHDLTIKKNRSSRAGYPEGIIDESKVILWGDPASLYPPQVICNDDSLKHFCIILENDFRDLLSYWNEIRGNHEANDLHKGEAFLLCGLKYFLVDPYVKDGACGLLKYSLNIGKMNLDLDSSSILSAALMFRQLEDHSQWTTRAGITPAISCPSSVLLDKSRINMENEVEFYANKIVGAVLNMIPDKNIHVGAVIAGLSVRVSLEEVFLGYIEKDISPVISQGNSFHWLKIDIGNTEFVIWPASKSVLSAMNAETFLVEVPSEYLWLVELQNLDAHQEENTDDKFISHARISLNACLRTNVVNVSSDFVLNKHSHIVEPISITTKASICRNYHHTFYGTTDVVSVALSLISSSIGVLFYMDELRTLFQSFEGMLLEVAFSYNNISSDGLGSSQDLVRKSRDDFRSVAIEYGSNLHSSVLLFSATFELESMDIILGELRKAQNTRTSKYDDLSHCSRSYLSLYLNKETRGLDLPNLLGVGLGFSIQKSCLKLSLEADTCDVFIDLSGLQTILLDLHCIMKISNDMIQMKEILSLKQSYRFHLAHCRLRLHASFHCGIIGCSNPSNAIHSLDSTNYQSSYEIEESHCKDGVPSILDDADLMYEFGNLQATNTHGPASGYSFVVVAELGDIIVSEYHDTVLFKRENQPSRFKMLIFSGEGLHKIVCKIKGGFIFLEALALTKLLHCFQVYLLLIASFPLRMVNTSRESSISRVSADNLVSPGSPSRNEQVISSALSTSSSETQNPMRWSFLDFLSIHLTQSSVILAVTGCSGKTEELVIEVDVLLRLVSFGRKIVVNLHRLSVSTQHLHKTMLNENGEVQIQHFCSRTSIASASEASSEKNSPQGSDYISSGPSMPHPIFDIEANNDTSHPFYHRHFILKHLVGSATVEIVDLECDKLLAEFYSNRAGKGSISGLNLMIKLSEIKMFLYLYSLFSEIFPADANGSIKQDVSSRNSGWGADSDYKIPDGAIVAIQDLQQHMYFAVEHVDNKFHMVGTLHYFLVGERALFKVRHHRRWGSRMLCMSFISLYAKNNKGEPLCMNFNPGSGFVGISGSDGNVSSLWQTFQSDFGHFEDDDDLKTYATARKAFHMVNLKSDCSVAFVEEMPEFVKKPGNQLKVKLFDGYALEKGIAGHLSKPFSDDAYIEHKKSSGSSAERSGLQTSLPHVNISVDDVTLTIFHEVSDVDDQLPLFRCCLDNIAFLGQILSTKLRVLSSFSAVLHQFDARTKIWREFIAPMEFFLFYRSRIAQVESLIRQHGIPVHFFLRMGHLDMSLTEVSLDALLFLIGELDLAGPYAVRRTLIFPNSCKLENCTDLTVLCQFPKSQNVVLSQGQSSSVLLRFAALAEQLPFNERSASIILSDNGGFSTSPISISLSSACFFAWRTRIVSPKDSRIFPGPFVVVEVSPNNEITIWNFVGRIVSYYFPLLRLRNESGFPMELLFRRPEEAKTESASILLEDGNSVDASRAVFDALDFYGGSKRTLMSLSLGKFLLSLRPRIADYTENNEKNISLLWSEEIEGGKALHISGIFDKLNYRFRKALGVKSSKSLFSTLSCPITMEDQHISDLHFLIRTIRRDVPLMQPQNLGDQKEGRSSPVAMQVQKEIFIYPTIQVYNLLQSEIFVFLSDDHPDKCIMEEFPYIGRQAIIPCQSSAYFYANPVNIYFRITLNAYSSTSKPVNSGAWVKKLEKRRNDVHFIDIELDFACGAYFAVLRLSCSDRGLLEATIFTAYSLQNNSELTLFCSSSSQKSHPRVQTETEMHSSDIPPESGCLLPPKSIKSWFFKSNKVYVKWLEEKTSMKMLDLDTLTGFTELSLEVADNAGIKVAKLGVSLQPCVHKVCVPTQVVSFVPRFIIANESKESIVVRQCHLQDAFIEETVVESGQRMLLLIRKKTGKRREHNLFDSVLKRHADRSENTQIFVQFYIKAVGCTSPSWSGPICIASLGRFFLKFKGCSVNSSSSTNPSNLRENKTTQFAVAHIVEERSSLILYFYMPPDIPLPYRIENLLQGASIKYYQKDLAEAEILPSGASAEYVWDDLSLPHKLIVEILDFHLMREINIDKVCKWKSFFKTRQHRGMLLHLPMNKQTENDQGTDREPQGIEIFKLGFEVYADGSTRVLRFCEFPKGMEQIAAQPSASIQLRLSSFAVHFLKNNKQMEDVGSNEPLNYATIIVARFGNVAVDSLITNHCKYNYLKVQSFTVDEKWQGAPFASMVRRSHLHDSGMNINILQIVFNILQFTNSKVKQVKYSSVIIQPIDLKIDEETLMKLVPFWRSSNSNSREKSRQFYFKHFEIHPIKITASFLPGNQYPGYSSAEETLRSFLHSILKVPSIKNVVFELNGVLLTHALVTSRELLIKCAQHYSWYLIRAIYITKGSSLLPPAFASIFDDTAASSLDVFFDPSDGSISLPGLTVGMFKVISKCVSTKGFSGTRRYVGDLGKTMKTAGANVLFATLTEISDNVLRGAETNGFKGLVAGFHQGILRLAMEPSLLGAAVMEGGPDRRIKLDRNPGVDELYIEGYLQAMLDVMYKLEYLRVRVIDDHVLLKNLPPNSSVINEIMENVKSFLVNKALLKGNSSASSRPLRHLRSENDWKLGPTVLTLCEHLFVSFTIRMLRNQANKFLIGFKLKGREEAKAEGGKSQNEKEQKPSRSWAVGKFFLSGMIAYIDGRLCRHIPNPLARRIVSGFLLSFLDRSDGQ